MFSTALYTVAALFALFIAQGADSTSNNFKEFGSLFLWGIAVAICLAVIMVLIRLKIQSGREATSDSVSINPSKHAER